MSRSDTNRAVPCDGAGITPSRLLAWAALGAAALAGLTALALRAEPAQAVDRTVLQGFQIGPNSAEPAMVHHIAHTAKPLPVVVLLGLALVVAAARRRPERALAAAAVVTLAGVSTQLLKTMLATTRPVAAAATYRVDAASYPSGHSTATLSIVIAAMLVAPAAMVRWVALAGGAWSIAVSVAMLILHRHFPSDLLAGYLVVAVWGLVVVAALRTWEARLRRPVALRSSAASRAESSLVSRIAATHRPD